MKLSVTHRGNLKKKYGDAGLAAIDAAVAAWRQANLARGFTTVHVAVDDRNDLAPYGVVPVAGKATATKIKKVIDQLCRQLAPEYLVILGSGDIVPHFEVANPTLDTTGDNDLSVPTDNPYASSRLFRANDRKTYLIPDRVLGRLPDLPGARDPALLIELLQLASGWQSRTAEDYSNDLLTCCAKWFPSGEACVRALSRSAAGLALSPPSSFTNQVFLDRHPHLLHMIKTHGALLDSRFFGEADDDFTGPEADRSPPIITSGTLAGTVRNGTVVGAMCCFGASLFDPNDPAAQLPGDLPIPLTYLRQGAFGFGGSTNTAWVGIGEMQCADWIVTGFLKNVLGGASLGRALLDAKQDFVDWIQKQGRSPWLAEEKTLLQFILLGDPAIHPVQTLPVSAPGAAAIAPVGVATAGLAAAAGPAAGRERTARRAFRLNLGAILRSALPERQEVGAEILSFVEPAAAAARILVATAAKARAVAGGALETAGDRREDGGDTSAGFDFARPSMVQRVAAKIPVVAALGTGIAAAGREIADRGPREVVEYYWTARQSRGPFTDIRMILVTADEDGNVLRSKMVASC